MIDHSKFEGHTKDIFIQLSGYNDRDGKPRFWLSNQEKEGFARCDAELYSHAPALLAENKALRQEVEGLKKTIYLLRIGRIWDDNGECLYCGANNENEIYVVREEVRGD